MPSTMQTAPTQKWSMNYGRIQSSDRTTTPTQGYRTCQKPETHESGVGGEGKHMDGGKKKNRPAQWWEGTTTRQAQIKCTGLQTCYLNENLAPFLSSKGLFIWSFRENCDMSHAYRFLAFHMKRTDARKTLANMLFKPNPRG